MATIRSDESGFTGEAMRMLVEVSQTLTWRSNLKEALTAAVGVAARMNGIDELFLILCDVEAGQITLEVCSKRRKSWRKTDLRKALQQCEPLEVSRSSSKDGKKSGSGVSAVSLLPLMIADEAVGVLGAQVSAEESRPLRELLVVVASLAAQAVNTHRLVEAATQRMLDDDANLRDELSKRYDFSRIIGNSGPMRQVYEQIAQVAPTTATVLIQGESGAGKELIAHALHINSSRSGGPFIKVNCAALNESLIEAELFGCERGAFTDAYAAKPGRFELASGGTIFLDEIGELSLTAQVKLLRVLQNRTYERIGGGETLTSDARVIAATNRPLEKEIAAGRFREDLYYRLNVFSITAPALRERRDDIPALARHFLALCSSAQGKQISNFAATTLDVLSRYDWPGNARELENVVERAVVVCDGGVIHPYHLPPALQALHVDAALAEVGLPNAIDRYERDLICEALRKTRGNRGQAARLLKISDRLLGYKIKKHDIVKRDFQT